jgi:DNA-directed RNA polymerase specialized sigma24 family protein
MLEREEFATWYREQHPRVLAALTIVAGSTDVAADATAAAAPSALQPEVWAAVRGLPDRQRTAVALRYVLDLPEAEVAALMGITRGAASSYLTSSGPGAGGG